MKEKLRKELQPYLNGLEEVANDKNRVEKAQNDCIMKKGYNGCWNCDLNNERCAVNQSKAMIEGRAKLLHKYIVLRVIDWLDCAE